MTYPLGWTEPLRQALKKVSAYLSDIADRLDAIESSPGATSWDASGSDIHNTNSGNVGIGTSSPDGRVHVASADDESSALVVDRNAGYAQTLNLWADASAHWVRSRGPKHLIIENSSGAHKLRLRTDGTDRISVSETGEVTISDLAGTGTRMVVVDANGTLSTQALP